MRLSAEEARTLAARAVRITPADEVEAVVISSASALTRFANNHIHQNVFEENAQLSIRAVIGKRIGVSATNRLDDESLAACAATAVESARHAPEDPDFPGLPSPQPIEAPDRGSDATTVFGAEERARAVAEIVEESSTRGLSAAGKVAVSDSAVAVANSLGVDAAMPVSDVKANVLSMGPDEGSGWSSFVGSDAKGASWSSLGDTAASLAERSAGPVTLDPDDYTIVFAPEAVADLLAMLAYTGFSAKSVAEGSSFMTGNIGERLAAETITIVDDALSTDALGLTFDWEGMPKQRVALIDRGVVNGPVTDSYWAARTGAANTGHGLPAPNALGPMTLDLEMAPGDALLDEMIGSVDAGLYVTRLHYVNVEDPVKAVLTGMTRDGTFRIENGSLTEPVKNLRFTQSAVEALDQVIAVGRDRERVGEMLGASLVPALTIEGFGITGQTG